MTTNQRNNSETIAAIKNCIGKIVDDVSRVQYFFNDKENSEGIGDLEFTFSDKHILSLLGIGDAESIKAINVKIDIPIAYNPTDNDVCSWKRIDLKKDKDWNKIVGQTLRKVEVVYYLNNYIIACLLHFDDDYILFYETGSDENRFVINERPEWVDKETEIKELE